MKKIPTIFRRENTGGHALTEEVTPGCEWVLAGEGVPTRKYDGTCVMFDGEKWWARREVKRGKTPPQNYVEVEADPETHKSFGWEPIEQSPFSKFHLEALENWYACGLGRSFHQMARSLGPGTYELRTDMKPGTYELCGPKINGNPERLNSHLLIKHEDAETFFGAPRTNFAEVQRLVLMLAEDVGWEGIVWHHPDGRMAKIKAKDFRR